MLSPVASDVDVCSFATTGGSMPGRDVAPLVDGATGGDSWSRGVEAAEWYGEPSAHGPSTISRNFVDDVSGKCTSQTLQAMCASAQRGEFL